MEKSGNSKKGEEIVLTAGNLSGDGRTVARHEGVVHFIEGAVPGDIVRARIRKFRKNFIEVRTSEILTPSPLRTRPLCSHFGVCGGCRWQDLAYPAQLEQKRSLVIDAFERIGGFSSPDVRPVVGCDDPYHYRNKMDYTFSNQRWLTAEEMAREDVSGDGLALGLHVPERYDKVLNLDECHLQSDLSAAILRSVREIFRVWDIGAYSTFTHEGYARHLVIRDGKRTGEVMVNVVTTWAWPEAMQNLTTLLLKQFPEITTIVNNITDRKSMVAFGDTETVYHGPGTIEEILGPFRFSISANSFFQTNTVQAEKLYELARQAGELRSSDVLYDLYCGTGTIGIYCSQDVERVVGVELVESAIEDARRNAARNSIANCYFIRGDLMKSLTVEDDWVREHPKPTVIMVDPPRSGLHPKVVDRILRFQPRRIVYVSCNPSTQARDAKLFADGGYSMGAIQPVDLFPHTDHIEAVAVFSK